MTQSSAQAVNTVHFYIKWHQLVGKDFELLFEPLGLEIEFEDPTSAEPPRVDVVILRRHTLEWTAEQYAFLPDGIRQSKASHNLIEHKQTESINLAVFKQALVYQTLYPAGHHVSEKNVQSFILSAHTPRAAVLEEAGFRQGELPGVFESDNLFMRKITLISLNDLQPTLNNAFVQCFASKRKVRQAAFERLIALGSKGLSEAFWDFLFGLRQQWEAKEGKMKIKKEIPILTPEMVMETGRQVRRLLLESLTPDELATLPLKKRLAGLEPEVVLSQFAPEQRLAGLDAEVIEAYLRQRQQAEQTAKDYKKKVTHRKAKPRDDDKES